jgi:tetratricopeptide (TPR) repeat protein
LWRRARTSLILGSANGRLQRALAANNIPGLVAGIQQIAQAVELIRTDDFGLQQVMTNVEQALAVIGNSGSPAELGAAAAACQHAASATPQPLLKATFQALLGNLLVRKLSRTAESADLEAAISAFQQAADTVPESDPIKAVYQDRLAQLQTGLAQMQEAGSAPPDISPEDERLMEQVEQTALAGTELIEQATRTGDLAALTAGIERLQQALEIAPTGDPLRPAIMTNLVNVLRIRYARTGRAADLDDALAAGQEALDLVTDDDPRRAIILSNLGLALLDMYRRTGSLDKLNEAVTVGQQSVRAAADETGRAPCLMNLGLSLQARFERAGEMSDADAAVEATGHALEADPGGPDRASYLTSYASALRLRGERTGSLPDIDAAVENDRQAVAASQGKDLGRAMRISHLSVSLLRRYGLTGELADLNDAVQAAYQSVAAATEDDPFRALCFTNLGISLLSRFNRDGALTDLNSAVDASRHAVGVLPETDPGRPRCLGNLANVLEARFARLGTLDDLDEAVDTSRKAVAACPADDANRGSYLNSLANALQLRFQRTGEGRDLDESVDFSRQALAVLPADHGMRGIVLASHALSLTFRYLEIGARADLDDAIGAGRRAVETAAADDPNRALFLSRILLPLWLRFELTGASEDLTEGLEDGREAAMATAAAPNARAGAAMVWGRFAARAGDWPEAVRAYQTAIDLLEKVAPRSLARRDQEYRLADVSGLGSRAAACCLQLGEIDLAAELLEHGRGVLLGQALDLRTDQTALAERHPDVAERFARCRDALDAGPEARPLGEPAGAGGGRLDMPDPEAERRRRLADDLDAVIAEARELPGFERFLLATPVHELLTTTEEGPVVLVNVDESRSDALILTPAGVRHVPLPALSAADVRIRVLDFLGALGELPDSAGQAMTSQSETTLSDVLGWLWDAIAGPVLEELGLTAQPAADRPWPRIWWCTTGLLSLLPLHAAGHHGTRFDAEPRTVIDRVVSSYTPTVRALLHGRRPPDTAATAAHQLLVVAAPQVTGAPELTYAADEVAFLRARFGKDVTVLNGVEGATPATYETVRTALPKFRWTHFACHALSRLDDPSASRLLLPGTDDGKLSVVDIGRLNLGNAELAFLSACSTAQTGVALPDEAINLAAAFQLAGYRRVVATMWPVEDKMALRLAKACYEELAPAGTAEAMARVLHDATRRSRATRADQPSMWAAYMHSGI